MKFEKLICDNCKTKNIGGSFCGNCKNPLTESAKQHFPELIKPKKSYLETRI